MAMLEWIHRNVDYVAGVRNAETPAERTFVDRAGVCRDFTHLGITFARSLGMGMSEVLCKRPLCWLLRVSELTLNSQFADGGKRSPNWMANCPIALVHSIARRHRMPAFLMAR